MWSSNLPHLIDINFVKHNSPNIGFNIGGKFGLPNRVSKVERGCIQGMS